MSTATLYTPTGAEPWFLGIDFGTTFTCAAVREGDQVRELHLDGSTRMPSAVLLDGENIIVGSAAESRAPLAPECFERTPKRYMQTGDEGILLGTTYVPIARLVGAVLRAVWDEALAQHGGRHPEETRLTHPAAWQSDRRQLLLDAAAEAGIPEPVLLPEPEAAAIFLARDDPSAALEQGSLSCVLDLGGGTFDVSVLRRTGNRFRVVGQSLGLDRTGGETFDDLLHHELGSSLGRRPGITSSTATASGCGRPRAAPPRARGQGGRIEGADASDRRARPGVAGATGDPRRLRAADRGRRRGGARRRRARARTGRRGALAALGRLSGRRLEPHPARATARCGAVRRADREKDPKSVVAQGAVAFSSALLGERPAVRNETAPKRPWWQLCAAVTAVALVAMAAFFLLGGGQKRLSGQILDHNGKPLAGIPIHIQAVAGKTKEWNVKTDSSGHFKVHGDPEKLNPTSIYVSAIFNYAAKKWEYQLDQIDKSGNFDYSHLDFKVALSGEHGGILAPIDIAGEGGDPVSVVGQAGEGAVLTVYLEPITGKLLDGTEAKLERYKLPIDDLHEIEGIPVGRYRVRAEVVRPDGSGFGVLFNDGDEGNLVPELEVTFAGMTPDPERVSLVLAPDPAILTAVNAAAGVVAQ